MSLSRSCKGRGKISAVKPIAACVILSVIVTFIAVCVISAVFALLESIAKNAVGPLSVVAAAVGCFVGAYVCAGTIKEKGVIIGGAVGVINFLFIFLAGSFGSGFAFGSTALIKLLVFTAAGCCGGYFGANGRYCGKRKK